MEYGSDRTEHYAESVAYLAIGDGHIISGMQLHTIGNADHCPSELVDDIT